MSFLGERSAFPLARALVEDRHARIRVYPQSATSVLQLTSGGAGAFGAWTVMIPINTILFTYHLCGFNMHSVTADDYWIQFAKAASPSSVQMLGEANEGVWGRLACGGVNTVGDFVLGISRHKEYAALPDTAWATWPW